MLLDCSSANVLIKNFGFLESNSVLIESIKSSDSLAKTLFKLRSFIKDCCSYRVITIAIGSRPLYKAVYISILPNALLASRRTKDLLSLSRIKCLIHSAERGLTQAEAIERKSTESSK